MVYSRVLFNRNTFAMADCDAKFGPKVDTACRSFDFTLYFEDVVFTVVPSAIFIILAFFSILRLLTQKNTVKTTALLWLKLVNPFLFVLGLHAAANKYRPSFQRSPFSRLLFWHCESSSSVYTRMPLSPPIFCRFLRQLWLWPFPGSSITDLSSRPPSWPSICPQFLCWRLLECAHCISSTAAHRPRRSRLLV